MMVAGMEAGRKILEAYSKLASEAVNDDELYTIVQTVAIAILSAEEPTEP